MDEFTREVLSLFGGHSGAIVFIISFALSFFAALGRGFLLSKPPYFSQRIVDSFMCGFVSIPITGIAMTEHNLSVWWIWASSFCFGSLGFMVFYEALRDLVPEIRNFLLRNGKR